MIPKDDVPSERWAEVGPFAVVESTVELFVAVNRLLGVEGAEQLLRQSPGTRQSLRSDADQLARVGLRDLAALLRRHVRRAPVAPPTFNERWRKTAQRK
jgi:hypothetical protein